MNTSSGQSATVVHRMTTEWSSAAGDARRRLRWGTMHSPADRSDLRVRPRIWIGVAVVVGYVALVSITQHLSGVPYPDLGDNGSTLFRGVGISLILGAIALTVVTTLLGWWRPAIREQHRSTSRWPVIAPALMTVLMLLNLIGTDWGAYDLGFFVASLVLLLVGFTEEIATRGLLITALRSRLGEGWVWFLSSLAFGLMHYVNVLSGQDFGRTSFQVLSAFLFGTVLYILRRITGTLVWAMVLHALWDFAVFATGKGHPASFTDMGGLELLIGAFALIAVWWVIRGSNEHLAETPALSSQPR
ncbi:lysostaphin resistance A-like protein [Curtobacterium flaccumfaciens]|uniref:CPBP family intramembrane glutamic endopeptidase n=2 Tax=Microbacteriaceae TaxID=85023 RepID=UPI0039F4D90A